MEKELKILTATKKENEKKAMSAADNDHQIDKEIGMIYTNSKNEVADLKKKNNINENNSD